MPAVMESAETINCVSKLSASCLHLNNLHPHSPQRKFCDTGLNRSGCNKMKSVFLDRKIILLFRIGLRSCQIYCLLSLWSLNSQESGSSSLKLSPELLPPEVFSKYSHHKCPKLTVIPVIRRSQRCALRFRPLYNRNNSDGKASLKRQRTPGTTTDTKDVIKFYWFYV